MIQHTQQEAPALLTSWTYHMSHNTL